MNHFYHFYQACGEGDLSTVRKILHLPASELGDEFNFNSHNPSWTPFFVSCRNGHEEIVKELLKDDRIDPNLSELNGLGWTPLYSACYNNRMRVVKVLVENIKVDVNKRDSRGQTPLYIASFMNLHDVMKALLSSPLVDGKTIARKLTDRDGNFEKFHGIFSEVDPLSLRRELGMQEFSPEELLIHLIADEQIDKAEQMLIKNKLDLSVKYTYNRNLLWIASYRGKSQSVRYLLKQPQFVSKHANEPDEIGRTPFDMAFINTDFKEVISSFLDPTGHVLDWRNILRHKNHPLVSSFISAHGLIANLTGTRFKTNFKSTMKWSDRRSRSDSSSDKTAENLNLLRFFLICRMLNSDIICMICFRSLNFGNSFPNEQLLEYLTNTSVDN